MRRLAIVLMFLVAVPSAAQISRHKISFEHATDCTTNVTGKDRQLCVDLDDGMVWRCDPTTGDCDTGAEWKPVGILVPFGTAPVVDADGEVAHDTTADQWLYGADPAVLHPVRCETLIIENLAAADDNYPLGMKNFARTITAIGLHCAGTCTLGADISLEDRAGTAMTHTVPTHSTGSTSTTFQNVTAANTLVSGEGLRFDVDNAVDPETDTYEITVCFTVDRQ